MGLLSHTDYDSYEWGCSHTLTVTRTSGAALTRWHAAARGVFETMLTEAGVAVYYQAMLASVQMDGLTSIVSVSTVAGTTFKAQVEDSNTARTRSSPGTPR